jgi:pimeloyl-ACP methyl ester carboxylesterase
MGRFATPALRQMQLDARSRVSPAAWMARLKAIARVNVSAELEALDVPTLYLRATEDWLVPRSAGEQFLRLARAGRVADLERPHFLLQDKPELAAAEVRKFLGGLTDC